MREDLKLRLGSVATNLSKLRKLAKLSTAESERLVSSLLEHLLSHGHTGRNKVVKLTKKLQAALRASASEVNNG